MVVVNLDLEAASGIWQKGSNIIVIPKSAFVNTELNAVIQQSVDAEGVVDWSKMPSCLKSNTKITGLERSNAEEETSEWLELLIIKDDCEVSDAEAILNLLLTGVINETTGELRKINEYFTGQRASLVNLPKDILDQIPLKDMGHQNDDQGSKPEELDEWVSHLVEIVFEQLAAIGNYLQGMIDAAREAGLKFLELIKEAIMWLIEAILKTALLVYIFAFYAILFAGLTFAIFTIFAFSAPIVGLLGGQILYTLSKLKINIFERLFEIGYKTLMEYNLFLDVYVPYISLYLLINNN